MKIEEILDKAFLKAMEKGWNPFACHDVEVKTDEIRQKYITDPKLYEPLLGNEFCQKFFGELVVATSIDYTTIKHNWGFDTPKNEYYCRECPAIRRNDVILYYNCRWKDGSLDKVPCTCGHQKMVDMHGLLPKTHEGWEYHQQLFSEEGVSYLEQFLED